MDNGADVYLMGDGSSVAVNVSATSFTIGSITGTGLSGFTPGPFSDGGSSNVDGFGALNQTIDSFDGFTHSSTQISFTITNSSGTWAADTSVLASNGAPNNAMAGTHIFVCADPCTTSSSALATGFGANGGAISTPEPASLALLGTALLGFRLLRRRRTQV